MFKNFLLVTLCILTCIYIWMKTPLSNSYYFGKAQKLFDAQSYSKAIVELEKITKPDTKARELYVQALVQSGTGYSVQKKLYEIANSDIEDEAKAEAKSELIKLKHKLLEGVEDNYIYNAISGKEIIHWDISKFPLKVYIEQTKDVPSYYYGNINRAFEQWSARSGFLKFEFVTNKNNADIVISFKNSVSGDCKGTNCTYMAAYTNPTIKSGNLLEKMNLTFNKTNPENLQFTTMEIYNTALHEIGHTLGIMGHSDNSSDIMYPNNERVNDVYSAYRSEFQYISMRDLKTLALLYRTEPTISNTKDLKNENFYYAPLILGNDEEVLQRKLTELERYIKNYPNFAAGYINIASVYADLGDFQSGLRALDTAQKLAKTNDELYLVEYNRAVLYYNRHDFSSAMSYATKARGIKQTPEVDELLDDLKKLIKK